MNSPCHPASQPLMLPSTCGMQPKLLHTYHTHKGLDYWSTPDHSPNSYQTLPPTAINTATHGLGGLFSKPLCPPTPGSDSCPQPELGPGHLVFALFLAWLFSSDAYPDLCYVRCGPTSSYGTLLNFFTCPLLLRRCSRFLEYNLNTQAQTLRTHLERVGFPLFQASEQLSLLERGTGALLDFLM